jgi:hypothetical protein
MVRRLSAGEREELGRRREQLELELRLVTAELRSDDALRLQDGERLAGERAEDRLRFTGRRRQDWMG